MPPDGRHTVDVVRLTYFGGFRLDPAEPHTAPVRGRGQEALLLRLALDAGTVVGQRPLVEDVWPTDEPDDPRAALQSLVSRLRRALPDGLVESASGGYRLALSRHDVDITAFQDLVAAARQTNDPVRAAALARDALALWTGDPWVPVDGFDWLVRDLMEDRANAERLATRGGVADTITSDVPAPLTSLVGRQHELALISSQIDNERLVTVLGPGGAGKTTLSLETARRRPGAVVVELAPAAPGEVWAAVAGAAGRGIRLSDTALASDRERALESLAGRAALVVLDNCEHVSAEAAQVTLELLRTAPGVRVLATSREPLGVPGEAFVDLGPLPETDAVELFGQRVRAARGESPRVEDAAVVARIVRRLDGLPLALELAAAKSRTLSLDEIDAGLDDRFALLAVGPRSAVPRHQTLRALIDWSWETLSESERTALLMASVFPDGIGVTDSSAAAREAGMDPAAFDLLVDRSLLRRSEGRFRMLETVREYGLDRLGAEGRGAVFHAAQVRTVVDRATQADAVLRGPRVREGLAWFDANEENVTAAVRTTIATDSLRTEGVRLVRASLWAWMMRERFDDLQRGILAFGSPTAPLESEADAVVQGVDAMVRVMMAARGGEVPDQQAFAERADAIIAAADRHASELTAALPTLLDGVRRALQQFAPGSVWSRDFRLDLRGTERLTDWTRAFLSMLASAIAQNTGDVETLGVESERALRLFRRLGDVWGIAFASQMRSEWLLLQGRLDEALDVADSATVGLEGLTSVSDVLQQRGLGVSALVRLGRLDEGRARLDDMLAVAHADGSERSILLAEFAAATFALATGDADDALRHLSLMPAGAESGPVDQLIAWGASLRARAHLLAERTEEARTEVLTALEPALRSGDQPVIADTALTLALLFAATGRPSDALRAFGASVRIRGALDATDPTVRRLRALVGDPTTAAPEEPSPDAALTELTLLARSLEETPG